MSRAAKQRDARPFRELAGADTVRLPDPYVVRADAEGTAVGADPADAADAGERVGAPGNESRFSGLPLFRDHAPSADPRPGQPPCVPGPCPAAPLHGTRRSAPEVEDPVACGMPPLC
ncbi:hypothetical protein TUSST3_28860 [Streptomyces sp. TUS-ST3]|nr:hypothetical protein TUSST3_28860 [Streptomyces sp. TUS-ST3]